jgi:hypothetical protein
MNKKPIILTLDLGTTTGWAIINKNEIIMSGTTSFNNRRFMRFMRWLDETLVLLGEIDLVYFEEVRRRPGRLPQNAYACYMASLTAWCESHKIPYKSVSVVTIKKALTGKGNSKKETVREAVADRGHKPEDNSEADAIALLYCVLENRKKGDL